jgi:hypothetical protein
MLTWTFVQQISEPFIRIRPWESSKGPSDPISLHTVVSVESLVCIIVGESGGEPIFVFFQP